MHNCNDAGILEGEEVHEAGVLRLQLAKDRVRKAFACHCRIMGIDGKRVAALPHVDVCGPANEPQLLRV
jgi:hypothetical protein